MPVHCVKHQPFINSFRTAINSRITLSKKIARNQSLQRQHFVKSNKPFHSHLQFSLFPLKHHTKFAPITLSSAVYCPYKFNFGIAQPHATRADNTGNFSQNTKGPAI